MELGYFCTRSHQLLIEAAPRRALIPCPCHEIARDRPPLKKERKEILVVWSWTGMHRSGLNKEMPAGYWEGTLHGVWNSTYLPTKSLSLIKARCGHMAEIDGNRWNTPPCQMNIWTLCSQKDKNGAKKMTTYGMNPCTWDVQKRRISRERRQSCGHLGLGGWDQGVAASGLQGSFTEMEMFSNWIVAMSAQLCKCSKNHWIVCLKRVNFTLCKLSLNKAVLKRRCKDLTLSAGTGIRASLHSFSICTPGLVLPLSQNPGGAGAKLLCYWKSVRHWPPWAGRVTQSPWASFSSSGQCWVGCFLKITGVPSTLKSDNIIVVTWCH